MSVGLLLVPNAVSKLSSKLLSSSSLPLCDTSSVSVDANVKSDAYPAVSEHRTASVSLSLAAQSLAPSPSRGSPPSPLALLFDGAAAARASAVGIYCTGVFVALAEKQVVRCTCALSGSSFSNVFTYINVEKLFLK